MAEGREKYIAGISGMVLCVCVCICVCVCVCVLHWQVDSLPLMPPGKPKYFANIYIFAKYLHGFHPWIRKIPWRRAWQPIPVFFPEESLGQRSWQATFHNVVKSQAQLK